MMMQGWVGNPSETKGDTSENTTDTTTIQVFKTSGRERIPVENLRIALPFK